MAEPESISVMVWRITGAVHDTGTAIATVPLWALRGRRRAVRLRRSVSRDMARSGSYGLSQGYLRWPERYAPEKGGANAARYLYRRSGGCGFGSRHRLMEQGEARTRLYVDRFLSNSTSSAHVVTFCSSAILSIQSATAFAFSWSSTVTAFLSSNSDKVL